MLDTRPLLLETDFPRLRRDRLTTLQVNLGYRCNLSCTHCHVNAGPKRTELMDSANIERLLEVLQARDIQTLDLTGGAPEMNPHFRDLVERASALGLEIIDRCNLTILLEDGFEDLPEFLARHRVTVVASLPCYSEQNVDSQRGKGVFESSIEALQVLNSVGYGAAGGCILDLVYNPGGPFLPPSQEQLEQEYRERLKADFNIAFNQLFTITNMPINRFGGVLLAKGQYDAYMKLLKDNFSEDNLAAVMCRSMISVDWQGYLYDCDFNQMLQLPLSENTASAGAKSDAGSRYPVIARSGRRHLQDLLDRTFSPTDIVVGEHCYGCTAGQGSSCGGALD